MSLNPRDGTTLAYMAIRLRSPSIGSAAWLRRKELLNSSDIIRLVSPRLISPSLSQTRLRDRLANRQEDQRAGVPWEGPDGRGRLRHAGAP